MRLDDVRVLAFGTTGSQGSGLVEAIETRGAVPVRVSSREDRVEAWRRAGVDAVLADLRLPDSVGAAAKEAQAAVLHVPVSLGPMQRTTSLLPALGALRDEGLPVVVNLGTPVPPDGAPDPMGARWLAEIAAAEGVAALAPTAYLENHAAPWAVRSLLTDELLYPRPAGDVVAWLTARDVTRAAVAALEADLSGEIVTLAGPQALTFDQLAAELGTGLGRPVRFRRVPAAEYGDMLRPYLGEEGAAAVSAAYGAMPEEPNPMMAPDTSGSWSRLGIAPTTAAEWSAAHLAPLLANLRA